MSDDHFLTTEEVLDYLQVNLRTVYRLIKAGKIPAVRVGRQWRFRKKDIDAWLGASGLASAEGDSARAAAQRPRILVVDDEQAVRDLLVKTLSIADYDVDTAADGPSALDRLRAVEYDLLITDLKMPGMDGLSVIREARRQSPDLPIVIITGYLDRGERHRGDQSRRLRLSDQAVPPAAHRRRGGRARSASRSRPSKPDRRPRRGRPDRGPAVACVSHDPALRTDQVVRRTRPARPGDLAASGTATGSACAGRTARARPRCCACSPASTNPTPGNVVKPADLTVGYLPQDGLEHSGRSLFDEASLAFKPLLDARAEIDRIEQRSPIRRCPTASTKACSSAITISRTTSAATRATAIELRVTQVLEGLGFAQDGLRQAAPRRSPADGRCASRSPSCCSGRPTLLLLDEPTNHLDLDARNWLEGYLAAYPHAVILVSHDRYFLDAVVTRIADISLRTITDYVGSYSQYLVERDAPPRAAPQGQARAGRGDRADAGVHRPLPLPGHQGRAGPEPHQDAGQGRADRGAARAQARAFHVSGLSEERAHGPRTRAACARRTDRRVVFGPRRPAHRARRPHCARRAQRRGQVDADAHAGAAPRRPIAGTRREGHQVVDAVLRAGRGESPRSRSRPCTKPSRRIRRSAMVPAIRNILGGFLFSGDDIYKKAGVLSGGERTRLAVARMLLRPANTLLLDEPTNHLDLDSKDVLLEALEDFGGTLIFVSHDRYFVDRLATKIIEVGHGRLEVYPGTYEQFLWSKAQRAPRPPISSQAAIAQTSPLPARSRRPPGRPEPKRRPALRTEEAHRRRRAPAAPGRRCARPPHRPSSRPALPNGSGPSRTSRPAWPARLLRRTRRGR